MPVLSTKKMACSTRLDSIGFRPAPGFRLYCLLGSRVCFGMSGSAICQKASDICQDCKVRGVRDMVSVLLTDRISHYLRLGSYGELDAARIALTGTRTAREKDRDKIKADTTLSEKDKAKALANSEARLKAVTDLLAQISAAAGAGGRPGGGAGGGGRGGQGTGGNPNGPGNRRTPGTLRGNDPQQGNRPVTPPPAEGGGESAAEGQPTPRPVLNTNALTTRLSRASQNIDALVEPLSPGNKTEAEAAIKAAKKAISEAKKLK